MPVLHLLAGPNGAGKSTYVAQVLQPEIHLPFINADEIAVQKWPDAQAKHAYAAAQMAAAERRRLLAGRESFITETVFSHPSKVDLVDQASHSKYLVHLHVILVPVDLAVARVSDRVRRGGHDVPEQKIRTRYDRLWALLADARVRADRTEFLDNSRAAAPFRPVAGFEHGHVVGEPHWPIWTPAALVD